MEMYELLARHTDSIVEFRANKARVEEEERRTRLISLINVIRESNAQKLRLLQQLEDAVDSFESNGEAIPHQIEETPTIGRDQGDIPEYESFSTQFYQVDAYNEEEMAIPFHYPIIEENPLLAALPSPIPFWDDGWNSNEDEEPKIEMAIPSPHDNIMGLEDTCGDHFQEGCEMAIPSPKEEILDPKDPEGVLKELECSPVLHEEKCLDGLQTPPPSPPCPQQSGKFSIPFCIVKFYVFNKNVLGHHIILSSFRGLKSWKSTRKKFLVLHIFINFHLVASTPSIVKSRNKFGKGSVHVPYDNG